MSNSDQNDAAINRAFTAQSNHYDADDFHNPILHAWRRQIYKHVDAYLRPASNLLELNAGTGIDALHFAHAGHNVLATDISDGMILQLRNKVEKEGPVSLRVKQLSFTNLSMLKGERFDYVFSNFGGLNCQSDLSCITRELHTLLKPGGYVTWVVMPPVSLWELAWGFKGNWKQAGRRLSQNGATAHLEGEYFKTYYHSLRSIRQQFGTDFLLIQVESLGNFSPPPSHLDFADRHPFLYSFLKMLERVTGRIFPFNRFGDHLIATFQRKS